MRDLGYSVTGVISHELLEILGDQLVDTTDFYDNGNGTGYIVLQEVCDPVEQLLYYEGPNGNIVSDFALPDWYVPGSPGPFDYLGYIAGAWTLYSGGYVSYQYIQLSGWLQASADMVSKVAENFRNRTASTGNPRSDVIRQIQARRGPESIRPKRRPPVPVRAASSRTAGRPGGSSRPSRPTALSWCHATRSRTSPRPGSNRPASPSALSASGSRPRAGPGFSLCRRG